MTRLSNMLLRRHVNQKSEYIHVINFFVSSWPLLSIFLARTCFEKMNSEAVGNKSDSLLSKISAKQLRYFHPSLQFVMLHLTLELRL